MSLKLINTIRFDSFSTKSNFFSYFQWRTELDEILEVAVVDGDPWVAMVAEILKTYPATGALNMEIGSATDEYTRKIFNDLANDLRKLGNFTHSSKITFS